jgi:hypothetical protein
MTEYFEPELPGFNAITFHNSELLRGIFPLNLNILNLDSIHPDLVRASSLQKPIDIAW